MRRGCRRTRQKDYLGFACRKIVGKVNDDLVVFANDHRRLVSVHAPSLPEGAAVHTPAPPWPSLGPGQASESLAHAVRSLAPIALVAKGLKVPDLRSPTKGKWDHVVNMKSDSLLSCRASSAKRATESIAFEHLQSNPEGNVSDVLFGEHDLTLGSPARGCALGDRRSLCLKLDEPFAGTNPTTEPTFVGAIRELWIRHPPLRLARSAARSLRFI